jgi:hypothetical protein
VIDTAGVERFARYAVPPNRHGYCGPEGFGAPAPHLEQIEAMRHTASEFVGAYPYLELLAGAASLDDPLADTAVEAYWIGNPTIQRVATADFGHSMIDRFRARSGRSWGHVELAVPGALCSHAFHVFVISPWIGLMRDGVVDEPLSIVDDCRISWGTVVSTGPGTAATVERTPLDWVGGCLVPGIVRTVDVQCELDVDVGDVVALHWGSVCDILTPTQLAWLRYITNSQLALAASVGQPC